MASAENLLLNSVCPHCMPRLSWYFSSLPRFAICVLVFGGIKWEFRDYGFSPYLFQFEIWTALKEKDFVSLMGRNADSSQSLKVELSFLASLIIEIWQVRFCPDLHICSTQLSSDLMWWQVQISGQGFGSAIRTWLTILFMQWRAPPLFPRAVCDSTELRTAKFVRSGFH